MPVKPVYDGARLHRVVVEQFGVVSRAQVLACGISRGRLDRLVGPGGRWQRILPGVYVTTNGAVTPDQRAMAALLHAGHKSVLTGAVAVRRHRVRCAGLNEVDVLVPASVRVRSTGFVRVIRTGRMPEKFFRTRQIRFALLDRAVADAARSMTRLGDVRAVVAEVLQNGRCDLPSLVTELDEGPIAGSRLYRAALREAGAGVRSAAEGDFKSLIDGSALAEPMYNAELYAADGAFLGIADAWWQRAGVVAEVDSREYHLSPDDYERTVLRHNRLAAHGINLLHFLPSTIKSKPSTVIADLRGAIGSGNAMPPLPVVAKPSDPAARGRLSATPSTPPIEVDGVADR
jgi:hypothetical protein